MLALSREEPPTSPSFERIRSVTSIEFIAVIRLKQNGLIIGMGSLRPMKLFKGYCGMVHEVSVLPQFRGQGLGRSIMAFLESQGAIFGMQYLELTSGRHQAQELYDKLGYERRDTVVFRKKI